MDTGTRTEEGARAGRSADWPIAARAAVLDGAGGAFRIVDVEMVPPGSGEVLVRLVASGLCHTDLNVKLGYYPTAFPIILGHEGAGVVEALGPNVQNLSVGDHVVLSFASCGACSQCLRAAPAYCDSFLPLNLSGLRRDGGSGVRLGGEPVGGHFFGQSSFATRTVVPARYAVPIRRDVPLERMAPLGCGVQTGAGAVLNVLRPARGSRFAVFGAGAVGLSAMLTARHLGCAELIAVDVRADRLALAERLGATHVVHAESGDPASVIQDRFGGVDCAVEASGRASAVEMAARSLAARGTLAVLGAPPPGSTAAVDLNQLLVGGKTIRGVMEGDSNPVHLIPDLVDLYASGAFPFDALSRTYAFKDIEQAAQDCLAGAAIKPLILFDEAYGR